MCQHCEAEVIKQGIKESDLPLLSYTEVKWKCVVPGCRGGCKLRDYGLDPFYYDIAKRRSDKEGNTRRGGWWDMTCHYYLCGRHWKDSDRIRQMMQHRFNPEFFLSKIVPINKKL